MYSARGGQGGFHLLCHLVDAVRETNSLPDQFHADGAEDLIEEGILLAAVRMVVRAVVQLDRGHRFERSRVAENKVHVPSVDPIDGALIETAIEHIAEVNDSDLREDQVAIRK